MIIAQQAAQTISPQTQKIPTVLIVDDTPANLETLHRYFEGLGFEIMMAQSGQTALRRAEYFKPDIILLDVLMPGMDGFETCLRFKSDETTKHIPIIFMTALDDTVHKVKGFQVGAADYITKPFQIEEVCARVQTHLALRDLQSKLERQNRRLQIEIQEKQEAAKALQRAAILEERSRLARELHDSVTQLMYSVNLFARASKDAYRLQNVKQGERNLARLEDTSQQALKELRLLLFELRPPELEQEGLIGALQHRLDAVEGRSGVKTQLLVNGEAGIPAAFEEALYAVAKEALNNALKHAKATTVTISLYAGSDNIDLTVVDNGIGFDPDSNQCGSGLGLSGMRERAARLGGMLAVDTKIEGGTAIKLTLGNLDRRKRLKYEQNE